MATHRNARFWQDVQLKHLPANKARILKCARVDDCAEGVRRRCEALIVGTIVRTDERTKRFAEFSRTRASLSVWSWLALLCFDFGLSSGLGLGLRSISCPARFVSRSGAIFSDFGRFHFSIYPSQCRTVLIEPEADERVEEDACSCEMKERRSKWKQTGWTLQQKQRLKTTLDPRMSANRKKTSEQWSTMFCMFHHLTKDLEKWAWPVSLLILIVVIIIIVLHSCALAL